MHNSKSPRYSTTISAPGKIILFGEHSVVYGKLALAASLGLRTKLTLEEHEFCETEANAVSFDFRPVNLALKFRTEDLRSGLLARPIPLTDPTRRYSPGKPELINDELLLEWVDAFIASRGEPNHSQIQRQSLKCALFLIAALIDRETTLRPFTLTITTDLSVGSGLGSSASFSVVVAAAFLRYSRFIDDFGEGELELISKWAYAAEKIIHGTPSGLDNTICTYGAIVQFRRGVAPKAVELRRKFRVLLVNTKIPRDTRALIAKVVALRRTFPGIVDHILNAMDEVANEALRSISGLNASEEVPVVYDELGVLCDVNQNLLRSLGVSHPSLDTICSILSGAGLHGKLTGAGGGGYAIAVIPPAYTKEAEVVERLVSLGFEAAVTDLGGPGVSLH